MVFVPKVVRLAILKHLFKHNGLSLEDTLRTQEVQQIVYKDDKGNNLHPRNLYVNMVMKSLCSKRYVKDTFAWQHHYYLLTREGEQYIRQVLDIEQHVRPDPCTKQISEKPIEERRQPREGFNRAPRPENRE